MYANRYRSERPTKHTRADHIRITAPTWADAWSAYRRKRPSRGEVITAWIYALSIAAMYGTIMAKIWPQG